MREGVKITYDGVTSLIDDPLTIFPPIASKNQIDEFEKNTFLNNCFQRLHSTEL